MIIKKIFSFLLIITLLIIVSPLISFSQTTPTAGSLEISISPENPEPLQSVKISLKSFSYDLTRSKITWLVNGLEKKTEIGLKEFTTQAGKNGLKTTVKARVETLEGIKEIEVSFVPSVIDLIYEALSYTPPFYKGKALNPNQGVVLITAIPELIKNTGEKISTKDIVYNWKKDGKVQQSASGIGKNTFAFTGSVPIRDSVIEVNASSLENDIFATKKINITNISPKIVFYENSPVYGIMMNKAIKSTVKMLVDEFGVVAVPYFFSAGYATAPDLDYVWNFNGKTVENQEPKNSFITKIENTGAGTADIGLKISNNFRIFQFTNNNYVINFEKK